MNAPVTPASEHAPHLARELFARPAEENHVVQFYEDERFLADAVSQFLVGGLRAGEPMVVVATPEHLRRIEERLTSAGHSLIAARRAGQIITLDAQATLSSFMVEGMPDEALFRRSIEPVFNEVRASTGGTRVRAYGEMVDLLCRDGNAAGAITLENLWNQLAAEQSFSLLCAYELGRFPRETHCDGFQAICQAHSHVLPAESYSAVEDPDARLREVTALQQRARALEAEIAHRREVEKELREALFVREEFLSVASHELRTPVTALKLQLQSMLAVEGRLQDAQLRERLGKASRQVGRISGLIEQLLDASSLRTCELSLDRVSVDLGQLVQETVQRAGDAFPPPSPDLSVTAEAGITGTWDPARLQHVIHHLVSNAVRYGRNRPVQVEVNRHGSRALIVVRDHGIGIRAEDRERIFERFARAVPTDNFGGFGLGLWIVHQIVAAHGGRITLESEVDTGSAFYVELPCDAATRSQAS